MVKLPTEHDLSNGGRRLRTDPRIEANEENSIRALDLSRPKRIAEEIKLHDWIRSTSFIIAAVSDLRFLRILFQEAGREALLNRIFQVLCLRLGTERPDRFAGAGRSGRKRLRNRGPGGP
jgi:hypothetical protein